jgi:hypothetical protein
VRPYFKEIREGKRPKVLFEEYVEMPEYQNIQTRMLGADSFPYKNVTITDKVNKIDSFFFTFFWESISFFFFMPFVPSSFYIIEFHSFYCYGVKCYCIRLYQSYLVRAVLTYFQLKSFIVVMI